MPLVISVAVLAGALGYFTKEVGDTTEKVSSSFLKVLLIGGGAYVVYKKLM